MAALMAAGAILIGKANLHEIGVGMTGLNPNHGPCRNPHNPRHIAGGSSSGCAAIVASGICPFAIGELPFTPLYGPRLATECDMLNWGEELIVNAQVSIPGLHATATWFVLLTDAQCKYWMLLRSRLVQDKVQMAL